MSKLEKLHQLLSEGRISRRDFIARVSALGLMAAVSPALLSGTAKAKKTKKVLSKSLGGAKSPACEGIHSVMF